MSIVVGVSAYMRGMAEVLMVDTVRIRRRSGAPVPDPVTGDLVSSYTTIYEGKCRLVLRSGVVRDVDAQSQLLAVQGPRLDVPVAGTGDVQADDEFEILSSVDSEMVGVKGRVAGRFDQSLKSARRLPVEVWS